MTKRAKTPNILQMEVVECGAACLAMVLGYYGKYVPLAELRETCGVSRDGSKASYIFKAAQHYGLEGKGCSVSVKQLKEMHLPAIVFWEFNHFVVVEGFKGDRVYLNDPAMGYRTVTLKEFQKSFTGVALILKPSEKFIKGGLKPNFLPALLRRLRGKSKSLTFLLLTGVLLIFPGIVLPLFSKIFVDDFLLQRLHGWLVPLLIGVLIATIFHGVLTWMQKYYLVRFRMQLALGTASQFFWHIMRLPMRFYSQRSPGDVAQRYGLCDQAAELISVNLIAVVLSLVTVLFYLALMLFYSVPLTLLGFTVTLINVLILYLFGRTQINFGKRLSRDMGSLYAMSMNGLRLIETYKAGAMEDSFFARVVGQVTKVVNAYQLAMKTSLKLESISFLLPSVNTVVVLGLGGYLVLQGQISLGMLVAFQALLTSFMLPFTHLVTMLNQFQQIQGDMTRLDDVISYPAMSESTASANDKLKLSGALSLNEVTFGYAHVAPPTLDHCSFSVAPGEIVGVVGASCSGRSTIARLVSGLYRPWSGDICFDDMLVEHINPELLHRSIAYVSQGMPLFEGSVRDNLTLWNSEVPEADMVWAAKDACIHNIIIDRQGGYDASIAEGGRNFSGGEQQRLELARALATNPSILVLDEALSALDEPVELKVLKNISQRKISVLLIAHRLSALKFCDRLIVLNDGKVVQEGSHDEHIQQEGLYRELVECN